MEADKRMVLRDRNNKELEAGQVVFRWHDTGAFGMQPIFGEIVRVNRVTVTVRWEFGNVWRINPADVTIETNEKFADEIRKEYPSISG